MAKLGDDCFFFYNQTCAKGPACKYRHVEEARASEVTCNDWRHGMCNKIACPYRHSQLQPNRQSTPCYYENQPGGCTRMDCPFSHQFPKTSLPGAPPVFAMQPPVTGPPPIRPGWAPPMHPTGLPGPPPSSVHSWTAPPRPPAMRPRFAPPPGPGAPFRPFPPGPHESMFGMDQAGDKIMPQVDPVIINLNSEESDQDSVKGASPQKQVGRIVQPPSQTRSDNPLDYFLNAKPWIDPRKRRTPSPKRSSPYRDRSRSQSHSRSRSRSRSPGSPDRRPSPARSLSPIGRRRSVSVDRQLNRRRSPSLDRSRSQSPDARDRRRFNRRSRSPERRHSRSPGPGRRRPPLPDLRSRLKPQVPKVPRLEEVKVMGPKIISTKKDCKKEEEEGEKAEEAEKAKEESDGKDFVEDEVKSLEEIYRERALRSMMDAKRKRILEQKKKRWESVKAEKKSESESSVKSDSEKQTEDREANGKQKEDEKDNKEEEEEEEEIASETEESEADLADDIDVEIDAGEVEEDERSGKETSGKSEGSSVEEEEEEQKKPESRKEKGLKKSHARSTVSKASPNKPSIKSRLGVRATEQVEKQALKDRRSADRNRARSIKERLGLKALDDMEGSTKPVRSGVIRLSRSSNDLPSRIRDRRGVLGQKLARSKEKELLLVPQITIKNNYDIEKRRAGIKQRLGMIIDNDSDSDSRRGHRKKRSLDEELLKLLEEEEVDLDESDMRLLTKKEKKKLLKKLLIQQGREDEYDIITKKKKKGKRRERDEYEEDGRRKISVRHRLGPTPEREVRESEEEVGDQLDSGEEIELEEPDQEGEDERTHEKSEEEEQEEEETVEPADVKENVPSPEKDPEAEKVVESRRREKAERLKAALEPKTLDDIRKERAEKRARGERITTGRSRRILLEEDIEEDIPPKSEPPVRVTFSDGEAVPKRKLVRAEDKTNTRVWSTADKQDKSRRERQIYIPPSLKRTDGPILLTKKTAEAVKKAAQPPAGRDVIDYGDMFPKKITSSISVTDTKPAAPRLMRLAEPPEAKSAVRADKVPEIKGTIRLQRGPPKVEVKDATVKTFAEIMAEKKRKRQQALQASNPERKPFTPITFDDPEPSSQSSTSSAKGEQLTTDVRSRLSPFEDSSSNDSTGLSFKTGKTLPVSSQAKPDSLPLSVSKNSASADSVTAKPGRWKRRKTNPDIAPAGVSKSQDSIVLNTQDKEEVIPLESSSAQLKSDTLCVDKPSPVIESKPEQAVGLPSKRPAPVKAEKWTEEREPEPEKKKRLSDSFLDLDDDFLNMDDEDLDLDLAGNQDHDQLMQEIDELLA